MIALLFLSLEFNLVVSSLSTFPVESLLFPNTLLCTAVLELLGRLSILDLICTNCVTCSGLVKKSPSMSCVGQYATFTSPFLILSVTKKYLTLRCLVRLLLDVFPFLCQRYCTLIVLVDCCGGYMLALRREEMSEPQYLSHRIVNSH